MSNQNNLSKTKRSALPSQGRLPQRGGKDLIRRQKQLNTWDGNILDNDLVKDLADEYEIAYQVHTDLDYWYEIDCNRKTIRCWNATGYGLSARAEIIKGKEVPLQ